MIDSCFDFISKNLTCTICDRWSNGSLGKIVDIKNDGNYRFVDYTTDAEGRVKKAHLTEEDEMRCPIVATGFVAFWLRNREKPVKSLFEEYYGTQLTAYIQAHQCDPDAWNRDLKKEFAMLRHILSECRAMNISKAIFPFLTKRDVSHISSLNSNYLSFVRKRRKELYPPSYPQENTMAEIFLKPFRKGGVALRCLQWVEQTYDLDAVAYCGDDRETDEKLNEVLAYMREDIIRQWRMSGYDEFNDRSRKICSSELKEEIKENLKALATEEERLRYIKSLIRPFKNFTSSFTMQPLIEQHEACIAEREEERKEWEQRDDMVVDPETGKLISKALRMASIDSSIQISLKIIEYSKEVERRFNQMVQHGLSQEFSEDEDPEMCTILGTCWGLMDALFLSLAHETFLRDISLNEVKKECGVYVVEGSIRWPSNEDSDNDEEQTLKWLNEMEIDAEEEIIESRAELFQVDDEQQGELEKKSAVTTKKARSSRKKADSSCEKTMKRYTLRYRNNCGDGAKRIDWVRRKMEEWHWLAPNTDIDDFYALFEEGDYHCQLSWTGAPATLYLLMQKLLNQPYFEKYPGCNASSLVKTQFNCGLDQHTKRVNPDDRDKIKMVLFLLDPHITIRSKLRNNREAMDISDEALAQAMVSDGEFRVRKSPY